MTDRFVPDKPGLYWVKARNGDPYIAAVVNSHDDDLRGVLAKGHPADNWPLDMVNWISHVTPPDVVADMVAALEAVASQADNRYELVYDALAKYHNSSYGEKDATTSA